MSVYIEGEKVKQPTECKICNNGKRPNAMHLRHTHNIEYEDYLKKYETDYYYFKKTAEKIFDLYQSDNSKWISQRDNGNYTKYDKNRGKKNIPFNW